MIRILLVLIALSSIIYFYVYPNIKFDNTPPTVETLSSLYKEKYILNLNKVNLLKVNDDFGLKHIKLSFLSKDTNNKYEVFYSKDISNNKTEYVLNLNKTMLKDLLSSYINEVKIKINVSDSAFKKNKVEKIFTFKIDSNKPYIKILKKSLNQLNVGSLVAISAEIYDKETEIGKILINGKENFGILSKNKKIYSLLIPVVEEMVKTKKLLIKVIDSSGNENEIKTYFLTKKIGKIYKVKDTTATKNKKNEIKHNEKVKFLNIVKELKNNVKEIETIIRKISKDIVVKKANKNTFARLESPIKNNDKLKRISFNDKIFDKSFYEKSNGSFIFANRYNKITSISSGVIVYINKLSILGNTIIIKHNDGFYSVSSSLKQVNKALKVGDKIKIKEFLGYPEYNPIFDSNFYFSVSYRNEYIKPYYFFNNKYYKNVLGKVFDKDKLR